jgi:pyridoxine kinase
MYRTLLERELRTLDAMKEALKQLHSYGPRNVVISSAELEHIDPDTLVLLASHQKGQGDEATFEQFMVRFPKLRGGFTGTGDLFAALLLARLDEEEKREQAEAVQTSATDGPLARACLKVLHTMTKTLKHTMQYQKDLPPNFPLRGDSRIARACELRLIECREFIEHPTGELTAELL